MSKIHKGLKTKEFPESKFVVDRYYCTKTGGLATVECKNVQVGWYKKGGLPEVCQKHSGELMPTPEEVKKAEKEKEEAQKENTSSTSSTNNTTSTTSSTSSTTSSNNSSNAQ